MYLDIGNHYTQESGFTITLGKVVVELGHAEFSAGLSFVAISL
jgi:hypothetical protein